MTLPAGARVELRIGPVAHGGHMVARTPEGQVVFVRHALPGEQVVVEITEDDGRFLRGDAVEVLEASPHRVVAPCPYAGPGACGGCDFQHVDLPEQRRLKAAVVSEQLARLAGLEREVVVEEVPPELRWRTRMQYVELPGGGVGLHKHRSHEVVQIDDCLIESRSQPVEQRGPSGPEPRNPATVMETVTTSYGTRTFEVAADGFWQPHVEAPRLLVETALGMLAPRAGEQALDLYAGVGVFSAFLAEAVGPGGRVVAVEGDRVASRLSLGNLTDLPWARAVHGRVDRVLRRGVGSADIVVLDPPRAGAKRAVVRAITALQPRAVAYVACDPAALARDLGYFAEEGYRLETLRAFDLFPMTHHVECVALVRAVNSIEDFLGLVTQLESVEVSDHDWYLKLEVAGRAFGYIWPPTRTVGLKQTLVEQAALVGERPEVFEVQFTAGGFGWVVVRLEACGPHRAGRAHLRGLASLGAGRTGRVRGASGSRADTHCRGQGFMCAARRDILTSR